MDTFLLGLFLILAGGIVWPFVARRNSVVAGWFSALVPLALFAWLVLQAGDVARGGYPVSSIEWVPQLGVTLDFRLDGPGLLLAMLVSGIGGLILIYGGGYFKGSPLAAPFFGFVQLFMVAMLGIASADHLLLLFVFWELTSLASYFLIGLSHTDDNARKSALRALLVTGMGGIALLAAILLLNNITGTFSLAAIQEKGDLVRFSHFHPALFVLIALAAFTKSAQFPFHFWLPDAMAAPTPVSAYLHSATMVKAGVFLLAKFSPILGGTALWHDTLTVVGAITMAMGGLLALGQTDLKRLLAYSTMSALGTLVMLLGIGTEAAITAAMVFLVVHALYKGPLFMIAGVVDKATGTRNINLLHGLGRKLPLLAMSAGLAAFSMSGLPPFVGFIGKELLYEAQMHAGDYAWLITFLGFSANAINVAVALKVGISPFRHRGSVPEINPKARTFNLLLGPMLLALAGVIIGIYPKALGQGLISAAVRDVLQQTVQTELKLWHGWSLLLAISFVTVIVGVLLYSFRDEVRAFVRRVVDSLPATASEFFDSALAMTVASAGRITSFIQHGNLRLYIGIILLCLASLIGASLVPVNFQIPQSGPVRFVPLSISLIMIMAGIAAINSGSTIMAILAMGGVGYGVALLFALFGAPDLALTQVLVETLMLVMFALVMRHLPNIKLSSRAPRRIADLAIAIAAGTAVTLAMLAVRGSPASEATRVSAEMAVRGFPEAHGRNIVNVILVDFRALDTLGEACVLAIAGIGVAGLLLGTGRRSREAERAIATPLFQTAVDWLSPLLIALSVMLLFRGHNEPGGGFIGGLVAGAGIMLRRLAVPSRPFHSGRKPFLFIAAGVATVLASALPAVALGRSFMEGIWGGSVWLPLVGKVKFGTPFLFDAGVYLLVIGACLLILARFLRGEKFQIAQDRD